MKQPSIDATYEDASRTPPGVPHAAGADDRFGTGRVTVLPRLSVDDEGSRLVQEERPRFEHVGALGEGGLGVVVAARDLDIGRQVAIKHIRPDRKSQSAFLRFVQEVRTVGRLDHPNIVPILDVGRDEHGGYYFVMKHVDGETLEAVIARLRAGDRATHARWTMERRADLFLQILYAVGFAHQQRIVHRDLKPANVMVGKNGEVQLLDWGVARQLDGPEIQTDGSDPSGRSGAVTTTQAGQVIGTPRYMSPEQARGEPVDEQADTWALSMLFYELLSLQHPFERSQSVEATLEAVKGAPIPSPTTFTSRVQDPVPAELGWYVFDGLNRDRNLRYRSVGQMIERLERRNDGDFPIQCPITFQKAMISRGTRWIDRHPWGSVVVLVGALCAVVTTGIGALGLLLAAVTGVALS